MEEQKRQILNEDLRPLLWKFSMPSIIGMVLIALYNFVDTIFVGNAVGPDAIAGLTIVLPILIFMIAIGLLTGVGAASIVSRSLGRGEVSRASIAGGNAMVINILLDIIVIAFFYFFMDHVLSFLGASGEVLVYAKEYLSVMLFGFIFYTFTVNGNNIIRAEGKPRAAMYAMIIGACLNMILDPIFIFVFGMGVRGVAIATVISQVTGTAYILLFFIFSNSVFKPKLPIFKIRKDVVREMLTVGTPSFLMEIIGSIMFLLFIRMVTKYGGDGYIAITGIGIRIIDLIFMPILGISHGFAPIVGFNYGAKLYLRVKNVLKEAFIWTSAISAIGFIFMVLFPGVLINIFTNDQSLVKDGVMPLRLIAMLAPLWSFPILGGTFFQAIGKAAPALFITLSRELLFFVPAIFILPLFYGLLGVWISWPVTDILSFAVTAGFLFREVKILNKYCLQPQKEMA